MRYWQSAAAYGAVKVLRGKVKAQFGLVREEQGVVLYSYGGVERRAKWRCKA